MDDDAARRELRTLRLVQEMSGAAVIVVDPDLTVVSASGRDLERPGFDPRSLAGHRLDRWLSDRESTTLLEAYRAALRGQVARVEYVDEPSGRLFEVDVRPLRDDDEVVVGAVARICDLSEVQAQRTHVAHVAEVQGLGVSTFGVTSGWRHDERAVALLGLSDPLTSFDELVDLVVVPDDRAEVRRRGAQMAAHGGRVVLSYRVLDHPAGEPGHRRVQTTVQAHVSADGSLVRAVATHVDVSAAAAASAALERAERRAQADRVGLVRDLSAMVARSSITVDEIVKTVTDLAVAVLGGGAFFAGLTADGDDLERVVTSHADPAAAQRLSAWWTDPVTRPAPDHDLLTGVLSTGRAFVSDGEPWGDPRPGGRAFHLAIVAVRARGRVVGVLGLQRQADEGSYPADDVDLARVMADHIGAAMVSEGADDPEQSEGAERRERARAAAASLLLADARTQRHSLVELLSESESRERMLLAEAVHDEPIQLIAAARLRLMALVRRLVKEGEQDPDGAAGRDEHETHLAWQRTVAEETTRVGDILETALDRLRLLIVALTPPDLSNGLLHVVGEVAEATFRGTGTTVRCLGPATLPLSAAQQDAALRILREALVNARHHAQATRVVVRATVDEIGTVLIVEDDGVGGPQVGAQVGAQVGPRKGHLGMAAMRARAQDAGGRLSVSSSPEAGTTVLLSFPRSD